MLKKYDIHGLDCANCAKKVEDALNALTSIDECTINFATSKLLIESKNEIPMDELLSVIQSIEPEVTLNTYNHHDHTNNQNRKHNKLVFSIKGLDCANCAKKVENTINKMDEVKEATLNFATEILKVTLQEHLEETEITNKLQSVIDEVEDGVTIALKKHHHNHDHHHHDSHHHNHDCCHEGHHHDHDHAHEIINETIIKDSLKFSIKGLDCANCAMKVENRINQMENVEQAAINFSTEVLQVKLYHHQQMKELIKEIQTVIDEVEEGVVIEEKQAVTIDEKPKLFIVKDHLDLIAGVIVLLFAELLSFDYSVILYLIAYLLIGHKVLWKAWRNILRGEIFDENFLMCVATIGVFVLGICFQTDDYLEAVAVMLFYSIGEIFQSYAVNKTRSSISALMDIKSDYANILVNGEIKKVSPEEVSIGDIIVVKVGEKIPLDGIVVKGSSMLDTSSLTGESVPRAIHENDNVLAGSINLNEILEIKATTYYEDSTVSKIIDLVENAASKKAPMERFITRFAKVYTPIVCFLALFVAIVPILLQSNQSDIWIYRALTFLVVSCPCALVISIPLGLYAGLGKASKMGVLIKGGNYLELLKDIDTFVFDKTGTLTKGTFEVLEVNGNEELLEISAYGEYLSNHPIAKSIVAKYDQPIDNKRITNFNEIAGKGIDVMIDSKHILLGNAKLMEANQIKYKNPNTVGTIVHVAIDNQYAGSIVVGDQMKETTISSIQQLKTQGIKHTVMLTGDHQDVANKIASDIGIDEVAAELLPQDKVQAVETLSNQGKKFAFVGDGINDAPVLARADIGVAMGGVGSDAAIEAADIVLMTDDIKALVDAIIISKKTNAILKQNVIFSIGIKVAVLILIMFGIANMWMGVFADVGVTLLAILNSMRALK